MNVEKIRKKMKEDWEKIEKEAIEEVKKEGPISEREAFDLDARMSRIWEKQEEDLMDRMIRAADPKRKKKKVGRKNG